MSHTTGIKLGEPLTEGELLPEDYAKGQEEAYVRDIERLKARKDEFVSVACPACGANETTAAFTKYSFSFVSCNGCKTLYMNPRPSVAVMSDYYSGSENYAFWAHYIFPASEDSRREKIHKPMLQRVVDYCDRHQVARGLLLEVGPGFGTFSSVAMESQKFERVLAVEPTPELVAACRERGVEVVAKRIEEAGDDVPTCDVLVSFEVIEHLFEPKSFLEQAAALVKPGGLMILTCPNGLGFDIAMLGAHSQAVDSEHVNLFNPDSLRGLVNSCGFDVLDVETPGRRDAELVRMAAQAGEIDLSGDPFLQRTLIDEWERLGWPFQQFLADNRLSAHMWLVARKR